jgi:hypothetical protein
MSATAANRRAGRKRASSSLRACVCLRACAGLALDWPPQHHSGEDYHLATGLRQGALQPLFSWPFYMPLALLGLPPHAFAAHAQLNTLYMYWIHTDLVNRLPFGLEYVMNRYCSTLLLNM